MKRSHPTVAGLALALTCGGVAAAAPETAAEKSENQAEFAGLKLGVGLSLTLDTGSHDRVNDAEIVAGLVRVKAEENARARILLESHYFLKPPGRFLGFGPEEGDWGIGPFVAIQPGDDEIVQAAGLGLMVGFRRPGTPDSWNIGVGVLYDPKTRTLGDGIVPDRPLPAGETAIRYKDRSQKGVVIMTSFTF